MSVFMAGNQITLSIKCKIIIN